MRDLVLQLLKRSKADILALLQEANELDQSNSDGIEELGRVIDSDLNIGTATYAAKFMWDGNSITGYRWDNVPGYLSWVNLGGSKWGIIHTHPERLGFLSNGDREFVLSDKVQLMLMAYGKGKIIAYWKEHGQPFEEEFDICPSGQSISEALDAEKNGIPISNQLKMFGDYDGDGRITIKDAMKEAQ